MEVLNFYVFKSFLMPPHFFSFLIFSIWTPMILMVGHLILSQNSQSFSKHFSFLLAHPTVFHLFPLFHLHHSSFSVSVILLLFPSRVLLISVISLIIAALLFFISSTSMVNMFISSQSGPPVYLLATPLTFQDFDHLYYHYSEFFFRKTSCLLSFCLVWWGFIMYFHQLHIFLPSHFV